MEKIPDLGVVNAEIENNKTRLFIEEYKKLCVKYARIFLPSLQITQLNDNSINDFNNPSTIIK
jgi:hypothetical protein